MGKEEIIAKKARTISSASSKTVKTAELSVSAHVTWEGALLRKDSELSPIAERLGGVMGGDDTGTVCLIFPSGGSAPKGGVVQVNGAVRWVKDEGSLALFVDKVIQHTKVKNQQDPNETIVLCMSAPVVRIAVLVLGGEDPASYRVLVKKSEDAHQLPGDQPVEEEGYRQTALRILSSALPILNAKLSALQSSVIEFGCGDEGERCM